LKFSKAYATPSTSCHLKDALRSRMACATICQHTIE
jgi:hypothetical protein